MTCLRLMLAALEYPQGDAFDPNDQQQFRHLVAWLEGMKIRLYKTEERETLRSTNHPQWNEEFKKYLQQLGCPINFDGKKTGWTAQWLAQWALQYEYQDNAASLNALGGQQERGHISGDTLFSDVGDPRVHEQLHSLCQVLGLQDIPSSITDKAKVIQDCLQNKVLPVTKSYAKGLFQLENYPLGFSTSDEVVDKAATLLRMLYVKDLRQLQSLIDETIVKVQEYTANPKTDSRLGRVGK